jgi:hypothetical protein
MYVSTSPPKFVSNYWKIARVSTWLQIARLKAQAIADISQCLFCSPQANCASSITRGQLMLPKVCFKPCKRRDVTLEPYLPVCFRISLGYFRLSSGSSSSYGLKADIGTALTGNRNGSG